MSPDGSQRPDPEPEESLAAKLKARFGEGVDPGVSLHAAEETGEQAADFSSALVARLSGRTGSFGRYLVKGEIARGGMGAILKIWDEDLHRHLAMKVILGQVEGGKAAGKNETPPITTSKLARFLEEAQVTGQLDHPGIVPVHELGLDPEGRVYFTMKLVKGQSLKEVFDLVAGGKEGWSQTKALGVLLKVCEAMAYAHDKGVIHRDLKPANVMVGRFGEVHVMDWGLARILGRDDEKDIRIREDAPRSSTELRSERDEHRGETPESPLYTMDGDVVGTPAYMPPEQAAGRVTEIGPHSDVYALGAMLYHLIAGHMPYVPSGALLNNYAVWGLVQQGPPTSIGRLSPDTPAELAAICEKAMAREWKHRYSDMSELAADLSAYLERRVVGAYEAGAWAETKKWVERNKPLAVSLAAALVILVLGIVASTLFAIDAKREARRADDKTAEAKGEALRAEQKTSEANRLRDEAVVREREQRVRGLIQDLALFESQDDSLDLAKEHSQSGSEWWLLRAHDLVDGVADGTARPLVDSKLEASGSRVYYASSWYPVRSFGVDKLGQAYVDFDWSPGLTDVEIQLSELRHRAASHEDQGKWVFFASQDTWWHTQLVQLEIGLKRLQSQIALAEVSVKNPENARAWSTAIAAIAASPKYGGLRISPQIGLVPIGLDPQSGLWEFAHLETGEPAQRGSDGSLVLRSETGLVFVLMPGGRVPVEEVDDGVEPLQELIGMDTDLDPFFLSKYEMTNAQWDRIGGRRRTGGVRRNDRFASQPLLPVTLVSWDDCSAALGKCLAWIWLPSEAQWEYACRAGTRTPWWTGKDAQSLVGAANLDFSTDKQGGHPLLEVGRLRSNAFGLHDVHGNVWEWCRDALSAAEGVVVRSGDGVKDDPDPWDRVLRGGDSWHDAADARSSQRSGYSPGVRAVGSGLRPARGLTP